MSRRAAITDFTGEYAFLSNFEPCDVQFDGRTWPTVEHAYQAAKTADRKEKAAIAKARSPGAAKRLGRTVKLRGGWTHVRHGIMLDLLRRKFCQPGFRERLLATGEARLIEGNTWRDEFWGCVWTDGGWKGRNELGRLLMQVRAELRAEAE